jgi:hypothetical protein
MDTTDALPLLDQVHPNLDIQSAINTLASFSYEEIEKTKKQQRNSIYTIENLKIMAESLTLPKSMSKEKLIDSIIQRVRNRIALSSIMISTNQSDTTTFRKDKNTFPRLCNFIMAYSDALMRSHLLATRIQLESGHINSSLPLFVESVLNFNDSKKDSGGLISEHSEFIKRLIDPEEVNTSGFMSEQYAFTLFQAARKKYATIVPKYQASGQHNSHDFFLFCCGDIEPLYIHLWLQHIGNTELTNYCREGYEISNGFDSSITQISSDLNSPTSSYEEKVGYKRNCDKHFSEMAAASSKRNEFLKDMTRSTEDVQSSIAFTNKQKAISEIMNQINGLEEVIDKLQDRKMIVSENLYADIDIRIYEKTVILAKFKNTLKNLIE